MIPCYDFPITNEGGRIMESSNKKGNRNFFAKMAPRMLSTIAVMALMVTSVNVGTNCWFVLGQDELPANAKKLRRF